MVIRIYDDFDAAQIARAELLRSGFGETCVHLTTRDDDAGPACGNFVLLGKDRAPDNAKGFFGNLFSAAGARAGKNSRTSRNDPQQIMQYGVYLLTVDAGDEFQCDRAADIMNRYGAFDVERVINRPGTP